MSHSRLSARALALLLLASLLPLTAAALGGPARTAAAPSNAIYLPIVRGLPRQPSAISFFGMNLYLTKVERRGAGDNLPLLADLAKQAGVAWTREELVWSLIEPNQGDRRGIYDSSLLLAANKGFGIIGMLLTTPQWARDPSCRPTREAYWCPPASASSYAAFAGWMAERYDGDGFQDAPGSPRIAAWELWNEPNDVGNWADIGADGDARKRRYGELMIASYQAIKAADPSATVLIGGSYLFDQGCAGGICDGINFLSGPNGVFRQLPQARQAFDVFATHPYADPTAPDALNLPRIVLIEGTTRAARGWLDSAPIGRPDARLWLTELGWCVKPGNCPGTAPVSEQQQANYLVRSMVLAQQNGAQHVSWFQFEDAFDDPNRLGGNAAIVRNYDGQTYPLKPAYAAYRTLATQLASAAPAGTGPAHTHVFDTSQPYTNSGGTYDYRYRRGAAVIDVLWRPNDTVSISFPVAAGQPVTLIDRDGGRTTLAPSGGAVQLTLSERPIIVVQGAPAR
jgi:hypothetical protein